MTHICFSKLIIIVSDNGLSPIRRLAIVWTNAGILWIGPLGTNFSEIFIEIYLFSFKKIYFPCWMLSQNVSPIQWLVLPDKCWKCTTNHSLVLLWSSICVPDIHNHITIIHSYGIDEIQLNGWLLFVLDKLCSQNDIPQMVVMYLCNHHLVMMTNVEKSLFVCLIQFNLINVIYLSTYRNLNSCLCGAYTFIHITSKYMALKKNVR